MDKQNIYTGSLLYKNVHFEFIFESNFLRLIPEKEKIKEVHSWFMESVTDGIYSFGDPIYIDTPLKGIINEMNKEIIFIPNYNPVSENNHFLRVEIESYIIKNSHKDCINRIGIMGPEIDHIFPTCLALSPFKYSEDGEWEVSTKKFETTTSSIQKFKFEDKEISIYFGISREYNYKIGEPPISLQSIMFFEFEKTNDYQFIVDLVAIARRFIQYLCYRKNIIFSEIIIGGPGTNSKHENFATLYELCENTHIESYPIEKNKLIKLKWLDNCEGKILNDIARGNLYMRHLPKSYEESKCVNEASFVMITSAFEWEFRRNYKNGISKSEETKSAELEVEEKIEELINNSVGKVKTKYKFLKKLIKSDSLSSEIKQVGVDYKKIIDIFGDRLYSLNNESFDYTEMGERLSTQRNNFAHGNLDKEFIGNSLLDLIFLERIIYVMQLKFYGLSDDSIKNAINDLF